jgi:carbonic anhydrase
LTQLPEGRISGEISLTGQIDLAAFVPRAAPVLAYAGSLSTPPCTTGVARFVVAQVSELSAEQLARIRQAVPRSARPTLERGDRPVTVRSLSSNPGSVAPTPTAP